MDSILCTNLNIKGCIYLHSIIIFIEVILAFSYIKGPTFNRCKIDEKRLQKWNICYTLLYLHIFRIRNLCGPGFPTKAKILEKGLVAITCLFFLKESDSFVHTVISLHSEFNQFFTKLYPMQLRLTLVHIQLSALEIH